MIIHFTTYPLQTGASLFTFLHADTVSSSHALPSQQQPVWTYDKSEDPALNTPGGVEEAGVKWGVLVTDDWGLWEGKGWEVVETIAGLAGVERRGKWCIGVKWEEKIAILIPSSD